MKKLKNDISVIIITRNRGEKLLQCLHNLSKSTVKKFEVVIIDQSDISEIAPAILKTASEFSRFTYIHSSLTGKARGLNLALKSSSARIFAFTDDDCVVDKKWLEVIHETFTKNPKVSAVFGNTTAYLPNQKKNYFCPATFISEVTRSHAIQGVQEWEKVGVGNNMAYRSSVFSELGAFKEWLGPGAVGSNGEDAEMALRVLIAGHLLFHNPQMKVAHDRWISLKELNTQDLSYICGEIACYTYLGLKGSIGIREILIDEIVSSFSIDLKNVFSYFIHLKKYAFSLLFWWVLKMIARLRGLIVASAYYLLD